SLASFFPSDSELRDTPRPKNEELPSLDGVTLLNFSGKTAEFALGGKKLDPVTLKVDGIYNVLNVAAALALVHTIIPEEANGKTLLKAVRDVRPAFGRGEAVIIDGNPLEIVLVKNPSGFRLALTSYARRPAATMIAINDRYADGRDMSWLWDVDFDSLRRIGVDMVSGIRAYDMALRLQYEDVPVGTVDTDVESALKHFIDHSKGTRRIYCSYTAMLALRKELSKTYKLEPIE
ncbi:Mur ligase, partial [Candidatus Saccharibacteria bacterium 32-45-3]